MGHKHCSVCCRSQMRYPTWLSKNWYRPHASALTWYIRLTTWMPGLGNYSAPGYPKKYVLKQYIGNLYLESGGSIHLRSFGILNISLWDDVLRDFGKLTDQDVLLVNFGAWCASRGLRITRYMLSGMLCLLFNDGRFIRWPVSFTCWTQCMKLGLQSQCACLLLCHLGMPKK
jgi:hypothetical protein